MAQWQQSVCLLTHWFCFHLDTGWRSHNVIRISYCVYILIGSQRNTTTKIKLSD